MPEQNDQDFLTAQLLEHSPREHGAIPDEIHDCLDPSLSFCALDDADLIDFVKVARPVKQQEVARRKLLRRRPADVRLANRVSRR